MQKEQRYFSVSLRSEGGAKRIVGRAAAYGVMSKDLGGFVERINRGAFADVVKRGVDCYALINHDPSKILGRTKSGTLQLRDTKDGLDFMLDLPNTPLGDEVSELCSRGDLNQCSFAFSVDGDDQTWDDEDYLDEEGERCHGTVRSLKRIANLQDISLVTYPAYSTGTKAAVVRSYFPEGIPAEVQRHISSEAKEFEARRARMFKRTKFLL